MIKRFVKMTFRPEAVAGFVGEIFEASKGKIRAFPGCRHMELLHEIGRPEVLCTLSFWDSVEALENYRRSELFRDTWAKTKAGFALPAEAWSLEVVDEPVV